MPRWSSFSAFLDEATAADTAARQGLVDALLQERPQWPWIEPSQAIFVYAESGAESVALNLDTIPGDPPFAPMTPLAGTTLWYVTYPFAPDDLLDYLLAVDDPQTPLAQETRRAGGGTLEARSAQPPAHDRRADERLGRAHGAGAPVPGLVGDARRAARSRLRAPGR
jgi:hypothetical protein